jgi:hypothetical protein
MSRYLLASSLSKYVLRRTRSTTLQTWLHVDGSMMVIPMASCMLLLCVGLSEAIEPDNRKHFLPASHVSTLSVPQLKSNLEWRRPRYIVGRTSAGESHAVIPAETSRSLKGRFQGSGAVQAKLAGRCLWQCRIQK